MNILSGYLMPHPPLIIPEIGGGEERKIQNTIDAMNDIGRDVKSLAPDTIVVITPHGNLFRDAVTVNCDRHLKGDFGSFGYTNIKMEFDNDFELANMIVENSEKHNISAIRVDEELKNDYMLDSRIDHGTMVPLHFVVNHYSDFKLVHITYGILSNEALYKFGKIVRDTVEELDLRAVVIASGDLSHKLIKSAPAGYSPKGKGFDESIMKYIENNNRLGIMSVDETYADEAGECGLRSLQILMGVLDGLETDNKVLSYEGPFGVGYGCAELKVKGESDKYRIFDQIVMENRSWMKKIRDKEDSFVRLARKTLETYVYEERTIKVDEEALDQSLLNDRAGVFVSIKKDGNLRGCIGTINPTKETIAQEIINNAISAGIHDPRFSPVGEGELEELVYSVDILSPAEKINSKSMLDPYNYGVIVTSGRKKGLLLPNLEGIGDVEEQLRIALSKAGINQWEEYEMERFKVTRHH
jgi:AmmeMemoRadiSam system protein A